MCQEKHEADEVRKQDLKHKQMVEQYLGDPDNNDDRNNFNLRNVPPGLKPIAAVMGFLNIIHNCADSSNTQLNPNDPKADPTLPAQSNLPIIQSDKIQPSTETEDIDTKSANTFNLPLPPKR